MIKSYHQELWLKLSQKKKLSGIPITGRASYRIKPKKKTKNKELDYVLLAFFEFEGANQAATRLAKDD